MGSPSLGVLIRNSWLLRIAAGLRQAAPTTRPFSSIRQADGQNLIPRPEALSSAFALNYVLKQEWLAVGVENAVAHTQKLAGLFRDEMQRRGIHTLGLSRESSVVVITGIPQLDAVYHALELKRLDSRKVAALLDNGQEISGIRFCFHHFHGDDDVRDLAELIGNTNAEADRPTAEGGLEPPVQRSLRQSA